VVGKARAAAAALVVLADVRAANSRIGRATSGRIGRAASGRVGDVGAAARGRVGDVGAAARGRVDVGVGGWLVGYFGC